VHPLSVVCADRGRGALPLRVRPAGCRAARRRRSETRRVGRMLPVSSRISRGAFRRYLGPFRFRHRTRYPSSCLATLIRFLLSKRLHGRRGIRETSDEITCRAFTPGVTQRGSADRARTREWPVSAYNAQQSQSTRLERHPIPRTHATKHRFSATRYTRLEPDPILFRSPRCAPGLDRCTPHPQCRGGVMPGGGKAHGQHLHGMRPDRAPEQLSSEPRAAVTA